MNEQINNIGHTERIGNQLSIKHPSAGSECKRVSNKGELWRHRSSYHLEYRWRQNRVQDPSLHKDLEGAGCDSDIIRTPDEDKLGLEAPPSPNHWMAYMLMQTKSAFKLEIVGN
ncbi:hypothetical protein O181_077995 [Austropuccinia psidii MF-1]|uniref:Uncharacterized protein n=1 Tax=Austropuccinia psidii MF-1 TaxID=1389203 RepID=A0A9Q3FIY7_9BASI|nr:hypothetical protein [Austropuccinia psidii MF-1]